MYHIVFNVSQLGFGERAWLLIELISRMALLDLLLSERV